MHASRFVSPFDLEIFYGFWKAMIAKALVTNSLPDMLIGGKHTAPELAKRTNTHPQKMYRLLRAAAAFDFIRAEEEEGHLVFSASEATEAMCYGKPIYYFISHVLNPHLVEAWNRLPQNLSEDKPALDAVLGGKTLWDYLDMDTHANDIFTNLMIASSLPVNSLLIQSYSDWAGTVVDVGGGHITFLQTLLETYPQVRGIIFDRQKNIDQIREEIDKANLTDCCSCIPGNFLEFVPKNGDIYFFKNVVHDWGDRELVDIFQSVYKASLPGSKILLAEMLVDERALSFEICGFDLDMMLENGGQQRTEVELSYLLQEGGFHLKRVLPVGIGVGTFQSPFSLLEAIRLS